MTRTEELRKEIKRLEGFVKQDQGTLAMLKTKSPFHPNTPEFADATKETYKRIDRLTDEIKMLKRELNDLYR